MSDGGIETDYWAPFEPPDDDPLGPVNINDEEPDELYMAEPGWRYLERRIKRLHRWLRQARKDIAHE